MSIKSDLHEIQVAKHINSLNPELIQASRSNLGVSYSDILIKRNINGQWIQSWLEVKMNHTDNLANPRFFYQNRQWKTTYETPISTFISSRLNQSEQTQEFIERFWKFYDKDRLTITSNRGDDRAVSLQSMNLMLEQCNNQYILNEDNVDLGQLVTEHYLYGKTYPAHYIQAGDDLYLIGNSNPLMFFEDVPILQGIGTLRVRVSTRTQFYEIQAEIKMKQMVNSPYSFHPSSVKSLPF